MTVILAFTALIVLLLAVSVPLLERSLAFHPIEGLTETPADYQLVFQEKRLVTSDGERLVVWRIPNRSSSCELIFFHGNAGNLSHWLPFLAEIHRAGYTVVAIDYRGYGESSGAPTEKGLYRDCDALLAWYWEEIRPEDRTVIYFGRSLGGVMAAYSASKWTPDGLILEATFPDKRRLVRRSFPMRILNLFSRYRFPTSKFAKAASCPTLVIHGDSDRVVPLSMGKELFEELPSPKQFFLIPGAGHNGQSQVAGKSYWEKLASFVAEVRNG